jgi:hypothetical protein
MGRFPFSFYKQLIIKRPEISIKSAGPGHAAFSVVLSYNKILSMVLKIGSARVLDYKAGAF